MSSYWTGYQMGQQAAETQNSAANLGHAFARALTSIPQTPSLRQQLDAVWEELNAERVSRNLSRATMAGLQAVIASLPPEHKAAVEKGMAQHFDNAFMRRAAELGIDPAASQKVIPATKNALLRK